MRKGMCISWTPAIFASARLPLTAPSARSPATACRERRRTAPRRGFSGQGIHVDSNGDLLVADVSSNVIRKLIFDSPIGLVPATDNLLTGPAGTTLPKPLRVIVTGRVGVAVAGVLVGWAVTSGAATVSANTSTTDSTGAASIGVTFGSTPGPIGVVAAVLGTTLGTQITLTSTVFNSNCPMGPPFITSAQSAGDYGGFPTFAPGSWLEVKGVNLALDARQWAGADFQGVNAPTGLDGSQVSINGHLGFVSYISTAQINVQAPGDTATGPVQLTVSNCAGTSAPFMLKEATISPGLLAPAAFNIGGKQYPAATFTDGVTFVGNTGLIAGVPFRPAKPGDTIIAYGIGFGGVLTGHRAGHNRRASEQHSRTDHLFRHHSGVNDVRRSDWGLYRIVRVLHHGSKRVRRRLPDQLQRGRNARAADAVPHRASIGRLWGEQFCPQPAFPPASPNGCPTSSSLRWFRKPRSDRIP